MLGQTSMLHARVDDHLKTKAAQALAGARLALSMPFESCLLGDCRRGNARWADCLSGYLYRWFRAKVRESMDDPGAFVP
jgi:DNA-damage-inducible protein J